MLLTDAGREVLALSERIEAAIKSCQASLDMIAGKTAGHVSIGAVSTAKYFVPFVISGFSRRIRMSMSRSRSATGRKSERPLRGYDLDFAIMGRPRSTSP